MKKNPRYGQLQQNGFGFPHEDARYFRFLQVWHSENSRNNWKHLHQHYAAINALQQVKLSTLSSFKCILLDESSLHIRAYADASFKNLRTKHSQIGLFIVLADRRDVLHFFHWRSYLAPRRATSTEQSELISLDECFRSLEHVRKSYQEMIWPANPVVRYVDVDTLRVNLMKEKSQLHQRLADVVVGILPKDVQIACVSSQLQSTLLALSQNENQTQSFKNPLKLMS